MSPITIQLAEATRTLVQPAAVADGVSEGRWGAMLIRAHAVHPWPQADLALAGRFADFPLLGHKPAPLPSDLPSLCA